MKLSDRVQAVHVDAEDLYHEVEASWTKEVLAPFQQAGKAPPEFVLLPSP